MLSENMASLGGEQINSTKDLSDSVIHKGSRPSSVEKIKTPGRDRDEKLRLAKERQNEERQRKIEELKAQAEAAQRYREQKEEERRRRIEELRNKDNDRRQQVEERKRAIMEAEKERREYILRKNQKLNTLQEREARLETKKRNERSSIAFAFGSSTPRLLDPTELGTVSPSTYWGHRRSTSITNVAYTGAPLTRRSSERDLADGSKKRAASAGGIDRQADEDTIDTPPLSYRSVARRKTDLMPTIPSPREPSFGSKSSLQSTPRTPGRAVSMNRLDQLAQPIRRYGEHIRAIVERERQQQLYDGLLPNSDPNSLTSPTTIKNFTTNNKKSMSRSMTHLAGNKPNFKQNTIDVAGSAMRRLRKLDACRSMTQLSTTANSSNTTTTTTTTITTKKIASRYLKIDRKDDAPISLTSTGSRSGDVTPGGSINTSRPGSAMSVSTTGSGLVQRRSAPPSRKPRPASIAVTGVSLNDEGKQKKEKPPLPRIQSTPKRMVNTANSSPRLSSADSNKQPERRMLFKKDSTPQKLATNNQMTQSMEAVKVSKATPSKPTVSEKLDTTTKVSEMVVDTATKENVIIASENLQTKEEKDALNTVKTEVNTIVDQTPEIAIEINNDKPESDQHSIEEVTEEKVDNGSEKGTKKEEKEATVVVEENRELSVERQDNEMTASMMAKKITTEEQAKAALAERRRLAREEAERQAELERQRVEAEKQAELQRLAEEEERQRIFEEETLRIAEEQRKAEDERLKQAIEEAERREEAEKLRREEEEKSRLEREEAEKKAKEDAEKQRLEIAERLKREEKEREERRKRVEAIMSRTRAKGGNSTNSTPTKDNENSKEEAKEKSPEENASEGKVLNNSPDHTEQSENIENSTQSVQQQQQQQPQQQIVEQTSYEQSVTDKENALMKSFTNMIIDENTKNLQNIQNPLVEVTNGKTLQQNQTNDIVSHAIANGNGHIENINKNDTNVLVDVPPSTITDQLIDLSNESQQITDVVNFNNNNSLLTTSTTLVTADSHENKEISLL